MDLMKVISNLKRSLDNSIFEVDEARFFQGHIVKLFVKEKFITQFEIRLGNDLDIQMMQEFCLGFILGLKFKNEFSFEHFEERN